MSTKIGLIGDVHATAAPLKDALSIFQQENIDIIICVGDIAGYGEALSHTVDLLIKSKCQTILGNHDIWFLDSPAAEKEKRVETFLKKLPSVLDLKIEGKHLYAVHASPPDSNMEGIKLLDVNGNILHNEIK
ncbi:MAG: metallophosphoesterase [Proteobacteria bacterium]|nr:metallophosphoesterase [Pseudomonadota bacterium]